MNGKLLRGTPLVLAWGVMGLCTAAAGEGPGRGRGEAGAPVPVRTAVAEKKAMPVEIDTFGTVEANATVTIRPQVTGVITAVRFKDGQMVKKGAPLFSIDERPFRADLERAEAQLKNAQNEFDRQKKLFDAGGTTESVYQQAEASLMTLKAAVKSAALNVEYCTINSPIDGRAGECLVDAGNMVKSGDATLVVINQIRPVQMSFSVPQGNLAEIKRRMAEGVLKVNATIPGQAKPEAGELAFVDNAVDRATGTIRLKAVFDNAAENLWPGQFVTVRMVLKVEPDAVVIPSKAIMNGQRGLYLFAIEGDGSEQNPLVARKREPVTVDREIGEESVITSGNVQPGETVVTDGQLRLVDKSKVTVSQPGAGGRAGPEEGPKNDKPGKTGAKAGGAPHP